MYRAGGQEFADAACWCAAYACVRAGRRKSGRGKELHRFDLAAQHVAHIGTVVRCAQDVAVA